MSKQLLEKLDYKKTTLESLSRKRLSASCVQSRRKKLEQINRRIYNIKFLEPLSSGVKSKENISDSLRKQLVEYENRKPSPVMDWTADFVAKYPLQGVVESDLQTGWPARRREQEKTQTSSWDTLRSKVKKAKKLASRK